MTAAPAAITISYAGGTVSASATCTIKADVTVSRDGQDWAIGAKVSVETIRFLIPASTSLCPPAVMQAAAPRRPDEEWKRVIASRIRELEG